MTIEGMRVLVTGASSGIGEACAEAFAEEGCRLVLLARRDERLAALANRLIAGSGVEVETAVVDVRDRRAVEAEIGRLEADARPIDILVNNAGLARGLAPLYEGEVADWEEMVATNLNGLLYVTRAVLPGMVARRRGHVITISSIAGHEVYPAGNVYCATKHAATALNRALAIDLLGTGVRASSVDPGLVDTEFSEVRFRGDRQRAAAVYEGIETLHAADVAAAVVFCATRPPHANVRELVLMPTAQASAVHLVREG